ncbi:MAG: hypothetical protein IM631_17255 [Cytophagales bacterium]|nr:hypothetical protein [Cytophagales bacterium]MCA6373121.1 hypothetical protein [Cytophagales bacterium]MCA6375563.1 hypothetical protein [Cytophagales bacterium]MCA6382850.1 hypothetical protein [Cytophagales bacterium]
MAQQAQVALPSFGAALMSVTKNERRISSCEACIRYSVPSVWVVLRDGGFFACSCLSMRLSGSFYFATANELVELYAQNLVFNPERINGATGSSCVAFVWRTH